MRLAGKLCRRGAWLIAAVGLTVIVYLTFFVINNAGDQASSGLDFRQLLISLALALLMAIPIGFFFLILFAVGAFLEYLSTEKNTQEVNDERVEIISLPEMR
jgi:TRAP-type C4-dicarboxylate transport system permease small subunit